MEENVLRISTQLNCLSVIYDHKDWESFLQPVSNNEFSQTNINIPSSNKFEWLKIETITEVYEGSLIILLPDVQETYCNVAHVKFSMNRTAGINTIIKKNYNFCKLI